MTIDELEIVINAKVDEAMKSVKGFVADVKKEMDTLNQSGFSIPDVKQNTSFFDKIKSALTQSKTSAEQLKQSLNGIDQPMTQLENATKSTSKQQEYLIAQIEQLKSVLDVINKVNSGTAISGKSELEIALNYGGQDPLKMEADLERLQNKLINLQQQDVNVKTEDGEVDDTNNKLTKTQSIINGVKGIASTAGNTLKSAFSKCGSAIKSASNGVKSFISKVKSSGKSITSSFNSGIKSIKKFALSLLSVRTGFSVISKAMQSYLSYDTQLSDSITNCWNVLGSLLAPILETLVGLFSKVVSYVNAFVTSLTGVNLVAKANAKALANETKEANNTTSSLDELHTISDSSDDSSTSAITVEDVSTDDILDKIMNYDWYSLGMEIGKKINDALKSIDWDFIMDLGTALATDLGDLINGLFDGIDWAVVGDTVGNGINTVINTIHTFFTTVNWDNIGSSIATGLNSAISTINWSNLGQTLMDKWNALLNMLYGFVTTFDWAGLGTSLSDMFMGAWNSIDWAKLATTISDGILGLLSSISSFIAGIDWKQLGNDIWTFISTIDWAGMISKLANVLGQAIGAIGSFLWGFIEDAVNSVKDYFVEKFEESGGNIIAGLCNGIVEALANIGQWIVDNIFTPFIDGFKSIFGIASPSTVMAEMGGYIIDGLKNGISGIWDKVSSIFTNLKDNIVSAFNTAKEKVTSVASGLKDKVTTTFSNMKSSVSTSFSNLKTKLSDTAINIKTTLSNKFSDVKDSMSTTFSNLKSSASTWGKDICSNLANGISSAKDKVTSAVSGVADKIKNLLGFSEPEEGALSDFHTYMPDMMDLMAKGIKDNVSTVTNEIEKLTNDMSYTITSETPNLVDNTGLLTSQSISLSADNLTSSSFTDMLNSAITNAVALSSSNNSTQKIEVEVSGKTEVSGDKLVVVYDKAKANKGYQGNSNKNFAY